MEVDTDELRWLAHEAADPRAYPSGDRLYAVMSAAADEIGRLRAQNNRMRRLLAGGDTDE